MVNKGYRRLGIQNTLDWEVSFYCPYTQYAGPEIPVDLCIASAFLRQIAIVIADPASALESMGANPSFRYGFVNIGLMYEKFLSESESVGLEIFVRVRVSRVRNILLRDPDYTGGPGTPFYPIGVNGKWDQHFRFLSTSRDICISGNFEARIVSIHHIDRDKDKQNGKGIFEVNES